MQHEQRTCVTDFLARDIFQRFRVQLIFSVSKIWSSFLIDREDLHIVTRQVRSHFNWEYTTMQNVLAVERVPVYN
jgi:hypothetical protein